MRWYLHVDMDSFYVSVERVLNPALKGKPVIVGGASGRGVVTSASYEARKYGVHSAMPGFQARKLCPQGIFLPSRRRVYSEYSEKVFAILDEYSPEVHAVSIDEGLVDLTGTERLLGVPLKTSHDIINRIEGDLGLPCSGGTFHQPRLGKDCRNLCQTPWAYICACPGRTKFSLPVASQGYSGSWPEDPRRVVSARNQNHRRSPKTP